MTHEEQLLDIERERLIMEKQRDRKASARFIIGSVLLAAGTTGVSLYSNSMQEKRALVNSERQWVVPMVMSIEAASFTKQIKLIDDLLSVGLTPSVNTYLKGERLAAVSDRKVYETKEKEILAAKEKVKQQKQLAEQAKLKAKEAENLAQEDLKKEAEKAEKAALLAAKQAEAVVATAEKEREAVLEQKLTKDIYRLRSLSNF